MADATLGQLGICILMTGLTLLMRGLFKSIHLC